MSKIWQRYKHKYRLTVLNDTTLEELFWLRLSRMNIVGVIGALTIIFILCIFALISYTPIKEFIPGYPDGETRTNIVKNVYRLDSVESQVRLNHQYINNIKIILKGESPKDYHTEASANFEKEKVDSVSLDILKNDSIFRAHIETENEYDILSATINLDKAMVFFPPIKGIVTRDFGLQNRHLGIDIAGKSGQSVFACYQGTVILSTWSLETGYVVTIQHSDNVISVYKHLRNVGVKQGSKVTTGRQIGKIGDVGTLSTGPHLHFELWRDGEAVSPNKFVNFD